VYAAAPTKAGLVARLMRLRSRFWPATTSIAPFMLTLSSQTLAVDLLNPTAENQARSHKLKRLVQNPNSFFMDVKCPGCFAITTVFSHAQTVVLCGSCATVLSQPTGGKARLTEGEWRRR
jgi:small subunit ribosomal protein S27e